MSSKSQETYLGEQSAEEHLLAFWNVHTWLMTCRTFEALQWANASFMFNKHKAWHHWYVPSTSHRNHMEMILEVKYWEHISECPQWERKRSALCVWGQSTQTAPRLIEKWDSSFPLQICKYHIISPLAGEWICSQSQMCIYVCMYCVYMCACVYTFFA